MTSRWISLQSRELTRWSWKLNIFTIEQYFLTKLPDYSHPWVPSQSDRCDSGGLCRGQAAAAAASVRQVPCLLFKWGLACHLHRSKPIAAGQQKYWEAGKIFPCNFVTGMQVKGWQGVMGRLSREKVRPKTKCHTTNSADSSFIGRIYPSTWNCAGPVFTVNTLCSVYIQNVLQSYKMFKYSLLS